MISRCPSCGVPAPDESLQCPNCGWEFFTHTKKGEKIPEPVAEQTTTPAPAIEESSNDPLLAPVLDSNPPPVNPLPPAEPAAPSAAPVEPASTGAALPIKPKPIAAFVLAAVGILALVGLFMSIRSSQRHTIPAAPSDDSASATSATLPPAAPIATEPAAPLRPTATFAQIARTKPIMNPQEVVKIPQEVVMNPVEAVKKISGPSWIFEGVVYDLLSTRGVFGARLIFVDAHGDKVASIETDANGHYRASMPPGPPGGYALRIAHDDYSGNRIDELESASSVRKADLEQRKFLMRASARKLPWIGVGGKTIHRDMALVPKENLE